MHPGTNIPHVWVLKTSTTVMVRTSGVPDPFFISMSDSSSSLTINHWADV